MPGIICFYPPTVCDLRKEYNNLSKNGFDFMITPLKNPIICSKIIASQEYIRSDTILSPDEWSKVICKINEYDLSYDQEEEYYRQRAEQGFNEEVQFANHVSGYSMYIELNLERNNVNLARHLSSSMKGVCVVEVPLRAAKNQSSIWRKDITDVRTADPWTCWNEFRSQLNFNPNVKLALELTKESLELSEDHLKRWIAEPIGFLIVSSKLFKYSNKRVLTLPKELMQMLTKFQPVNFIVKATNEDFRLKSYSKFLADINAKYFKKNPKQLENRLCVPYHSFLDNLENYQKLIVDTGKYELYLKAIVHALKDKSLENTGPNKIVVLVLGARSESILYAVINAASQTNISVKIFVVDDNKHCILIMKSYIEQLNFHNSLIDIAFLANNESDLGIKADVVVTDCLSSFGDDYLGPERFDCIKNYLKANAIVIPSKSTSWLHPVMSSTFFNKCKNFYRLNDSPYFKIQIGINLETTFLVNANSVYHISSPEKLFTFTYPTQLKHSRYNTVKFKANSDAVIHGFLGYFDAVLYKETEVTNLPRETNSSWCAFYFPIATPQFVKANDEIETHFWRCSSRDESVVKVWYEWCLSKPFVTHIHNLNGTSFTVHS